MNIIGTAIFVLLTTIILNFVFKKYQILIDQTNFSFHKRYINGHKDTPLLGGLIFFLTLIFFYLKIINTLIY